MADRREFAAHHRRLLQLERAAEVAEAERVLATCTDQELVARGATLLRLEVVDLAPGFGGRLHATLRPSRGGDLPPHRFGPGDLVALRRGRDDPEAAARAVVVRARRADIIVAAVGRPIGAWESIPVIQGTLLLGFRLDHSPRSSSAVMSGTPSIAMVSSVFSGCRRCA